MNELPEKVKGFLKYLKGIKNKSQNTIDGYEIDLRMFFRWYKLDRGLVSEDTKFQSIDISDITDNHIKSISLQDLYNFVYYLQNERKNTEKSRARKIATLKSFFNYLETKVKVIKENPTRELETPKINKNRPIYLTMEECKKILNATKDGRIREKRNYCMMVIVLNCGLRINEILNLKLEDISEDTLKIEAGKGGEERFVYINDIVREAVKDYIEEEGIIRGKMFNITKEQANNVIKDYCKKANINKNITSHKLRHTFASITMKKTKDMKYIQETLGHKNLSSTQIYVHVLDEDKKKYANEVQIG
ncbi:tyrosine-type recombinase/integrase [Clostridium botulinum]|uniref:tyrosine-type recombinase/integrase n=1 Tax=Clostridium botulinum TaxID=1491 RepID=UPI00174D83A4|nr:tyrosine-type recombinase/integrase [Clostridium botulinum]MBD5589365.1 tyrosine-type recombinase/integrase [Clostridium botulinum]